MDVYSLPVPGSGGKTCSQIFDEAGCDTPASPSCGACLGGPKDTYARMNEPMASYSYPSFAPFQIVLLVVQHNLALYFRKEILISSYNI
jgi:hypothetical protein